MWILRITLYPISCPRSFPEQLLNLPLLSFVHNPFAIVKNSLGLRHNLCCPKASFEY